VLVDKSCCFVPEGNTVWHTRFGRGGGSHEPPGLAVGGPALVLHPWPEMPMWQACLDVQQLPAEFDHSRQMIAELLVAPGGRRRRHGEVPAKRPEYAVAGDGVPFVSGIDTPEIGSHARCIKERKLALIPKERLNELLAEKGLRVEWSGAVDATPSHRPLVNIYRANDEEIGKTLLREGFAREWRPGHRNDWCD
jgi:hypothetical protein